MNGERARVHQHPASTHGMTPGARRAVYRLYVAVVVLIIAVLLVAWRSIGEPQRVRHNTDRRFEQLTRQQQAATASLVRDFCAYIAPQADPDPPPTTERGRLAQKAAVRLSQRLHCPPS